MEGLRKFFGGVSIILAIIAIILCFTGVGAIVGVPLLAIARLMRYLGDKILYGKTGDAFMAIMGLTTVLVVIVFIFTAL